MKAEPETVFTPAVIAQLLQEKGWTELRWKYAKHLYEDGLACSDISRRFQGQVSRNAVIGILHRKGIAQNARRNINPNRARAPKKKIKPQPVKLVIKPALPPRLDIHPLGTFQELVIPVKERKSIMTLGNHDCRWPIGDPVGDKANFHFCGKEQFPGRVYCQHHAMAAYRPLQVKARPVHGPIVNPVLEAAGGELKGGCGKGSQKEKSKAGTLVGAGK